MADWRSAGLASQTQIHDLRPVPRRAIAGWRAWPFIGAGDACTTVGHHISGHHELGTCRPGRQAPTLAAHAWRAAAHWTGHRRRPSAPQFEEAAGAATRWAGGPPRGATNGRGPALSCRVGEQAVRPFPAGAGAGYRVNRCTGASGGPYRSCPCRTPPPRAAPGARWQPIAENNPSRAFSRIPREPCKAWAGTERP